MASRRMVIALVCALGTGCARTGFGDLTTPSGDTTPYDHVAAGSVVPEPACSDCHDDIYGTDPIVDVHRDTCASCHLDPLGSGPLVEPYESTVPEGGVCTTCHVDEATAHAAMSHLALAGQADIMIFPDNGHDSAGWTGDPPYFSVLVDCTLCHTTDLLAAHADVCTTCHPTPVDEVRPWGGGCQEGDCHATFHDDMFVAHEPFENTADVSVDCDWCHEPTVGPVVQDNCLSCHAARSGTDTTPPVTTSDAIANYLGPARVRFSIEEAGLVDVGTTFRILDGAPPEPGSTVFVPEAGAHTLEFWSVDQQGNVESPSNTVGFSVAEDQVAPVTVSNATALYYQGAVIVLTATDNSTLGVRGTYYTLNNGPLQTGTRLYVAPVSGSVDYTLTFWSDDWADNTEIANTADFTVVGGTATIRLVWGDSDTNGPPAHPDAAADWEIRLINFTGTLIASGAGANPDWSGVDDETVNVIGQPYYVIVNWYNTTLGFWDQSTFADVYATTAGEVIRLSY